MRNRSISFAVLPVFVALAACAESSDGSGTDITTPAAEATPTPEATETGGSIAVTESGWLTVGTDGAVQTTFFDAGGRYRDLRNGEPFAEGSWQQRPDGRVCFEPDSGLGACWETTVPDENGDATATNDDGKSITIKRITYIAPPEDDEGG